MHRTIIYLFLLGLGAESIAFGQESLLIGSGDQLHVKVFDTPEMEQHPRVTDAGAIPLLFVGDVRVGGLTPGDAARAIEAALLEKGYMLHPHVDITVEDFGTQQVSVMGEVKLPGAYNITAPEPILSVLSMAGGLTEQANRHITIQRSGGANETINYFLSNTSEVAFSKKLVVNPGDTVFIPKADVVYVLGDVQKPGGFSMSDNDSQMTLLQVLALSGLDHKTAQLGKARLLRRTDGSSTEVPINIAGIQKGKLPDVIMAPNDILYIPSSMLKTFVTSNTALASAATTAVIYHPF